MRASFILRSGLTLAVLAGAPAFVAAQPTLQHVKDLYAQAAYEDALGALSNLPGTDTTAEALRYRAACLLALGRADEARKTVEQNVLAHPEYAPDPAETSPRVLELFKAARRSKLPQVVRTTYAEAKSALDRQELPAAIHGFELILRLAGDADLANDTTVSELKILAAGFLDLTRARVPTPAKPEDTAAPSSPSSAPAAVAPVITPAVAISQQLPTWVAPDGLAQRWEFVGAVRLELDAEGNVVSAEMEKSVHPAYDWRLLAAAKKWRYQPAKQNGVPVPSSMTVRVVLKPR